MTYEFQAELWEYGGQASWYFITLPRDIAEEISQLELLPRRGFGSLRVQATIGATAWQTSIFPDKTTNSYLLPIKKAVRQSESLQGGSRASVILTLAL